MDKQKASYGIDERALRAAAPWLRSCPEIALGGINAQLLGGLTSKSDTIYVQCKCPSCSSKPGLGLHNLVAHVAHVTDEDMPANICRTVLFFQAEGGTQTPFKTYMKLVGQQYSGREVIGRNIWLFRFDKETTTAAGIAAGAGVWVEAQVVGYNEKSGEHEVQFSEGSPLTGQRVKILFGATHIHFGSEPPADGEPPNRTPPEGLASENVPGQPKQQQKQLAPAAALRALKPVSTGRAAAAAAATLGGTRSPSKRQAALAAPAHWAAAGIPTSAATVAAAKRPAAAAAAAAGNGGSKKARNSQPGNGSMSQPGGYPVVLTLGGVGGGPSHHQRHMMMYATHAQQMLGDGGLGGSYGHDRRLGRPPAGNMGPEPQSKTSRFRGVSWNKRTLKWQVTLYARGRYRYFGSYTNQEEAACAYDRAALVWKGPSAQLNYPASTYLKGNQKQALQLLQEQAQQEAAKGNEPPPELPAGEAGTAALAAVAAKEEAAAAAAAGYGGHGSRGASPAAAAAAAAATAGVRVSARRRGSSSSDHADMAVKAEAAAEPAAAAAAADGEDDDIPSNVDELSDGLEGDGGSDLEGDQAGGTVSNTPGGDGGAGGWVSLGGFKKKRKRKAQGKLFTRKKLHKQELPLLGPTSMQSYATNGLYPPSGLPKSAAAKAPEQLPPLSKEQQLVAAATAAAAAAAAAGRVVGAAKRKPGRPPKEHIRQAQAAAAEPQLLAAAAVAAGVKQVKSDRPSSAGAGNKLERGGSADSSDGQQQQEPGSTRRSARRKQQQLQQGEAAVDKSEDAAEAAQKPRRSKHGSSTPDSDKAAAAPGDAAEVGEDAAAVAASEGAVAASGSEGGVSGDEGEQEDAEAGEGGSGAEEEGAITTRRSQRQAARKAQKKTARRMASVVNVRSDGLWARLMQRAGSDAGSSDEDDSAGVDSLGLERGDIEAMAAAAQAAGLPRDAVLSAHEAALKMLESSTAGRGRNRGRGRGRRGQGRRGRPPGSGIAARMAELHAQFLALGGMYPAAGKGDKGPGRDDNSEGLGFAGSEDLEGLADAVEQLSAHDGEGSAGEDDQGLDEDQEMYDDEGLGDDDADVAELLLGLTGGAGRSRAAAAAGDEDVEAEGDEADQDATAAAAAAAAAEYDGEIEHADRDSFAGGNGHLLHPSFTDGPASHKTAGGRVMPQRDRGYNSKYDDMEDWQPRSARGRARGRGRSTRGRAAAASYAAAAAAASYSGQEQQHYYAAQQQQYGRGLGRAIRGRPRAAPLGGFGGYGPGAGGMPGLGYPCWQQQQHVAAAGMPVNPAAFAMPGMRWPNLPGQQQHGEDGGSGSEAEGDDHQQQQQQQPVLDQTAAEDLLNKSNPQQVAQHFVQVMFMAFTTGAPQFLQEFQALYAALCNSPAHMQKVMAMLFQFGTQMGASIAASGGAPTVAAAFSNMAAMAGMGGMHDMSHMAAAASAADMLAQQMQAAAAVGVAANGSMAPPAAGAAVTPSKAAAAAAADDGSKTTATADGAAAAAGSAVKAPAAAAAAGGSVPSLRSPWPLISPGMAPSGFPPGASLPGFHPAMAAAAAASMPPDYMRLMMGLGLPLEESDESESEQDDEDVEVTRMAAGAAAAAAKPTEAKAATAAPATVDQTKVQATASAAPQAPTVTEDPAAAAVAAGNADKQDLAAEMAGHNTKSGTDAAAAADSEQPAACVGPPSVTEGGAPAVGPNPAMVTGPGVEATAGPAAAATLLVAPDTSAAIPAVKNGGQPAGVGSLAAAASSSPGAATASAAPAIHPAAMVPPAAAAAISAMPPETTGAAAASMPIGSSTGMMMQHPAMAPIGYQQPSGYYVLPTAAGFVAMPGMPRTAYGHMPMQQHMQMHQQMMMQQQQQPQQYVLAQFMPQQQQQHMLMQQQQMMQQQKRGLNLQQPAQPINQQQLLHPMQPAAQQQHRGQQHLKPQVPPVVLNLAAAAPAGQQPQQQQVSVNGALVGAPPRQPQTPATALGGVSGHVLGLDLAPPTAEEPLSTTVQPLAATADAAEPDLECSKATEFIGNQLKTPHAAAVSAVDTPVVLAPLAQAAVGPGGSPPMQGYVMHPGAPTGVTYPAGSAGVPVSGIDVHMQPSFTTINGHVAH